MFYAEFVVFDAEFVVFDAEFGTPQDRLAPEGFPWPEAGTPVCFVDVGDGLEAAGENGTSLFNEREARLAVVLGERRFLG